MRHLSFVIFILALQSCSFNCTKGEGPVIEKEIDLDIINSIDVSSSADVFLSFDLNQKVIVKGQENIIDLLQKEVDKGEWKIDFTDNVCYSKKFEVHISTPSIKQVDINGSGEVTMLTPMHADEFELNINGSGDVDLDLNTKELYVEIDGSGEVAIKGFSDLMEIDVSGSGNVKARDLKVKEAEVDVNGSGDCVLTVTEYLDVSINGSGNVTYYGDTEEVQMKNNGSGQVIKK